MGADGAPSPLEQVNSQQEVLRQKLVREVATEQKAAEKMAIKDPKGALESLKKVREKITGAEVEPAARKQLLTLVDRSINELSNWIEQNKATLENTEKNNATSSDDDRAPISSVEAMRKPAIVNPLRTLIASYPRAISRSAANPPMMPTVAMPAKLNVVYKLLDDNERWRASFK